MRCARAQINTAQPAQFSGVKMRPNEQASVQDLFYRQHTVYRDICIFFFSSLLSFCLKMIT